jgi:hypothetical protein
MIINGQKIFVWSVISVMAVAVVVGLFLSGSPTQERARRFDEQRVADLQQIAAAVDQYSSNKANIEPMIPPSLITLTGLREVYVRSIHDPSTNEPYGYNPLTKTTYQLCATFETDSSKDPNLAMDTGNTFWLHGAGLKCFDLEVAKNIQGKQYPMAVPEQPATPESPPATPVQK